jgi:hypothetical protein
LNPLLLLSENFILFCCTILGGSYRIAAGKNAVENNNLCVTDSCKYRYGDVRMIGGGGAIVGGVVVGSAILAEETESFQE